MAKNKLTEEPEELWTIAKYARETGDTEAAIRSRISNGSYVENIHYFRKKNGRGIRLDPKKCKQHWYEQ